MDEKKPFRMRPEDVVPKPNEHIPPDFWKGIALEPDEKTFSPPIPSHPKAR